MSGRSLAAILILPVFLSLGCQQPYMRGYIDGMNHADEFNKQVRRVDDIEAREDKADMAAKLKICEGTLDIYKAGRK